MELVGARASGLALAGRLGWIVECRAAPARDPPGGWVLVLLAFMCIVTVASWGMFLIGWETS